MLRNPTQLETDSVEGSVTQQQSVAFDQQQRKSWAPSPNTTLPASTFTGSGMLGHSTQLETDSVEGSVTQQRSVSLASGPDETRGYSPNLPQGVVGRPDETHGYSPNLQKGVIR